MASKHTDPDENDPMTNLKNLNIKESNESKNNDTKQTKGNGRHTVFGFWNINGLKNELNNSEFEKWLDNKDIVALETWVTAKQWNDLNIENKYKNFKWKKQYAIKAKETGRAREGIIVGVKNKWKIVNAQEQPVCSGTMMIEVQSERTKETWHICVVYRRTNNYDDIMAEITKWTYKKPGSQFIMGGDWNLRVKNIAGGFDENWIAQSRQSEDKTSERLGEKWMEALRYSCWNILNGCTAGDKNGTYTRKASTSASVIDYVAVKGVDITRVDKLKVEEDYDEYKISDHRPLEVTIKSKETQREANENDPTTNESKITVFGFWNINGLKKKLNNSEFEKWLDNKDIVTLVETWVMAEKWNDLNIETKYPNFIWEKRSAIKKNKMGRAMEGIIVGVRKEWEFVNPQEQPVCPGTMMIEVQSKGTQETWHICAIYQKNNYDDIMAEITKWTNKNAGSQFIMGGDWNLRVNEIDGGFDENGNAQSRQSEDKKREPLGEKWMKALRDDRWNILNGCTAGDKNGIYTRKVSTLPSVIDYVAVKGVDITRVINLKVEKDYDEYNISDHRPLEVTIKNKEKEEF